MASPPIVRTLGRPDGAKPLATKDGERYRRSGPRPQVLHASIAGDRSSPGRVAAAAGPGPRRQMGSTAVSFRRLLSRNFVLSGSLCIGQLPAAAEGLVERDVRGEPVAPDLRERLLGREELLLGLEHLVVAGEPEAIAIGGQRDRLLQRLDGAVLAGLGIAQLGQRRQAVRDLAPRGEDRLLVLEHGLVPLREGSAVVLEDAPPLEDRSGECPGDGPHQRAPARDRRYLR